MILSSWQFILAFLPVTFAVYFLLNGSGQVRVGKAWLVVASLFFYAYWDVQNLVLMLSSIALNFAIGTTLSRSKPQAGSGTGMTPQARRSILRGGIAINLLLLVFYKYTDFMVFNFNWVTGADLPQPEVLLPLAISFFTFTQIAYLVDSYRGEATEYDLLNYTLFVTYFPHLIAGPIVHHREMMRQFASPRTLGLRYRNILQGLLLFSIGLFKKVAIADTFAVWADAGFRTGDIGFYEAWAASLSYTFQLYFDFSGYCDMALGASLMFNIRLPLNFDSPYKARDIQDFWRRWHISLSNFLRDYLYIPLGGSRAGELRTYLNLFVTFLLGGLWHGASWMFVIWGALHGAALMLHRAWKRLGRPLPGALAWLVTFLFVNVTWVFFRAPDWKVAASVLGGMVNWDSAFGQSVGSLRTADLSRGGWLSDVLLQVLPNGLVPHVSTYLAIAAAFYLASQPNSQQIAASVPSRGKVLALAGLASVGLYFTVAQTSAVFLYYNF